MRRLREKGYSIPQRSEVAVPMETQEVVCLPVKGGTLADRIIQEQHINGITNPAAIRIDWHGVTIEISNDAALDTITNTFLALPNLC